MLLCISLRLQVGNLPARNRCRPARNLAGASRMTDRSNGTNKCLLYHKSTGFPWKPIILILSPFRASQPPLLTGNFIRPSSRPDLQPVLASLSMPTPARWPCSRKQRCPSLPSPKARPSHLLAPPRPRIPFQKTHFIMPALHLADYPSCGLFIMRANDFTDEPFAVSWFHGNTV